jgi:hypothetical protein
MNELVQAMVKYAVGVCAMYEIRWPGKGSVIKTGLYDFIYWT